MDPIQGLSEAPQEGFRLEKKQSEVNLSNEAGVLELLRAKFVWLFLSLLCIFLLGSSVSILSDQRQTNELYSYPIQFGFSGVENGTYPNEAPFEISDLISPVVLEKIYRDRIDGKYDLNRALFAKNFSVVSYNPTRLAIIEKYEERLANRRSSFAEANELQLQMQQELGNSARRFATISYNNTDTNLPASFVHELLVGVVSEWTKHSIENRAVVRLNIRPVGPEIFNEGRLEGLDIHSQAEIIITGFSQLTGFINRMSNIEGGNLEVSPVSNMNLGELKARLKVDQKRIVDIVRGIQSISKDGVVGYENLLSGAAFSEQLLTNTEIQIAYDLLLERIEDVRRNIAVLSAVELGNVVADKSTGLTALNLANVLNDLEEFQVRPLREAVLKAGGQNGNSDSVKSYFQQQLRDAERRREGLKLTEQQLEKVAGRYGRFNAESSPTFGTAPSNSGQVSSFAPQFDSTFLNRIIELGNSDNESNFRQVLANRALALGDTIAKADTKIARLKQDIKIFETAEENVTQASRNNATIANANLELKRLHSEIQSYLEATVRIGQKLKVSDELLQIVELLAGTESGAPAISRAELLLFPSTSQVDVPDVLQSLRETTFVANKIYEQLSARLLGNGQLYKSLSSPYLVAEPLLGRHSILGILASFFLGCLVAAIMFGWFFLMSREKTIA